MSKKNIGIIGGFTFLFLLVLSIIYYVERCVFIDTAYQLFSIVKNKSLAIQHYRIAAFISQIFPYLAARFNLPIHYVALVYSAGFVVIYGITFLFILYGLKNTRMALAYLLFNTLFFSHCFWNVNSELPQGMPFLFLFLALLDNAIQHNSFSFKFYLIVLPLLVVALFSHPLMLISVVFCLAFFYISNVLYRKQLSLLALMAFLIVVCKKIFFASSYEKQAMSGLTNFVKLFPNYFSTASMQSFVHHLMDNYYFLVLGAVAVWGFYIFQKSYLKLTFNIISTIGYFLLVNVSNANMPHLFYLENQYLVFGVLIGLPLAYDILPSLQLRWLKNGIVIVICILAIVRIMDTKKAYTLRLNWYRDFMHKTSSLPHNKFVLRQNEVPKDILMLTWCSSFEVWLLSTLEQGKSRSVIIENQPKEFDWAMCHKNAFISNWDLLFYDSLDAKYFIFKDTGVYKHLTDPQ